MITNNKSNYDQNDSLYSRYAQSIKSYSKEENIRQQEEVQEQFLNADQAAADNNYLDNEFSNALERDDRQTPEEQYDDSALEEDDDNLDNDLEDDDDLDEDLEDDQELDPEDLDDDLVERYDENDREPETFSDDGYKID